MMVDFSDVNGLLTRGDGSVWRIKSYCACPTVIILNVETGETRSFGINGLMANGWSRLIPETPALASQDGGK